MGVRTGRPRGRPPGALNKATVERQVFTAEAIKAAVESGESPLEVMLKVMRGDPAITERQFQAATAAAPYVHPRLAAVDANHSGDVGLTVEIVRFDEDTASE